MKKTITLMSCLLLCGVLLMVPQRASAQAMQTLCAAHDDQLAQDMATTAATLLAFHGAVGMTCSYIALTFVAEREARVSGESINTLSKIVPRVITASRGFFKVMVPSSDKAYNALKSHNETFAKLFQGSFKGAMGSGNYRSLTSINRCKKAAEVLHILRAAMLAGMTYLAVAKTLCATAKAIDPYCKKSSKHKDRCVLPVYNELSIVPGNWTRAKTTCDAAQDNKLQAYINLAQSNQSTLQGIANFNKNLKQLLGSIGNQLRQGQQVASSVGNGLNGLSNGFQQLKSILSTLNSGLQRLNGLLSHRVCVSIKVPGKEKKCKKIAGKKVCVWKPTMETKNICMSIKDIANAASSIQKPLEDAADAVAKPIMNLLPKSLPLPGVEQAKALASRLQSALSIGGIDSLASSLEKAKQYVNVLNKINTDLQSIRSGLR